jgi:hypothetical protein
VDITVSLEQYTAAISFGTFRNLYEVLDSFRAFPEAVRDGRVSLEAYRGLPVLLQELRRIVIDQPQLPVSVRATQEAILGFIEALITTTTQGTGGSIHPAADAAELALEGLRRYVFNEPT